MLGLYEERYSGFTVKHFHEQLQKRHDYKLGYPVTRLALQGAGLVRPAPRRSAHRKKRPRRPMLGMMLHQDASRFAWLPGDDRQYDLVVTLDDATSAVYSGFIVEEEGTASSFRGLTEVLVRITTRWIGQPQVAPLLSLYWQSARRCCRPMPQRGPVACGTGLITATTTIMIDITDGMTIGSGTTGVGGTTVNAVVDLGSRSGGPWFLLPQVLTTVFRPSSPPQPAIHCSCGGYSISNIEYRTIFGGSLSPTPTARILFSQA